MNSRLRTYAYLVLAVAIALVCGACDSFNLFSWIGGDSQNYDNLMSIANAALASGNDAAALEAYTKALQLKSNDVPALDGCVRAELSLLSTGKTVSSAFPQFFVNRSGVSNPTTPIFSDMLPTEQTAFRAHILAIRKNVAALGDIYLSSEMPLKSQHARFAADAGFVYSMNALLLAEDGNQNGILGETDDSLYVGASFALVSRAGEVLFWHHINSPHYRFLESAIQEAKEACLWFTQLILINPDIIGQNTPMYELYSNISYLMSLCELWS